MSNVTKVKTYDVANGKGIRTSIFFSGCEFACKGCFNKDIWDFNIGEHFDINFYNNKIKPTINEHINGISILGGEPLHPNNIQSTAELVLLFKLDFPDKNIWIWTGFDWETLMTQINTIWTDDTNKYYTTNLKTILYNIDILVDGRFIEEEKDLTLKWRGSKNQRVIDAQKSLHNNKIVLFED